MSNLPASFIAEARKLTEEQVIALLGEIVEPSIHTPFDLSDDTMDALMPVTDAYRANYADVTGSLSDEWRDAA